MELLSALLGEVCDGKGLGGKIMSSSLCIFSSICLVDIQSEMSERPLEIKDWRLAEILGQQRAIWESA